MNHESPIEYVGRALKALGQEAHNPEAALIWAYDHPPNRPLPDVAGGIREWHTYIERRIGQCFVAISGSKTQMDGLINAVLRQWLADYAPEMWAMFHRHEQEIKARLTALRQNEPELEAKEEV